jgi:hypothetical protein
MVKCPNCRECDFPKGVCERLANRGRRFFLMGALAVPLAHKIERVAKAIVPYQRPPGMITLHYADGEKLVYEAPKLTKLPDGWILHNMEWAVAT